MPLNFDLLDSQYPQKLGSLFDPSVIQEKQNRLSDLAAGREMQKMQMVQTADAMNKTLKIQAIMKQYGADPVKAVQALNTGGFIQEAGLLAAAHKKENTIVPHDASVLGPDGKLIFTAPSATKDWQNPEFQANEIAKEQRALAKAKELAGFTAGLKPPADTLAREKFEWEKSGGKLNAKPLPATALKMQNDAVDAVGALSSLNADLGTIKSNIETGALNLGMISNLVNKARNYGGLSTEESRNLATFQATLERLRNESLRLNKGVQTEGDSVRAWNEILANINDPQLVQQRLDEVMKTNKRAVELRKLEVDNIRANYGHDPLDLTGQENVKPALTNTRGGQPPQSNAGTNQYEQTATNPQTGQKIGLRNGQWEPIK